MTRIRVRKRGKTFSYIFEAGKTLEGKRKVVEKGGFSTKHLTLEILDKWMRGLQKSGHSKSTLARIHALIHHALNYAVYPAEIISSNPANYIKVPKKLRQTL